MNCRKLGAGKVIQGSFRCVLAVGSLSWGVSAIAQEATEPEHRTRPQPVPSQEPDLGLFYSDQGERPLPPQLQRDFMPPDPRLPWGYRQYAPPFSQRFRGRSRSTYPYGYSDYINPGYGYSYGRDYREPSGRYQGRSYDYGYGSYYRDYPPRDGYGDPNAFRYEEVYRRGVDDGRRFEQFERQVELGLASYLQAMENGLTSFARSDYSAAARSFILGARLNQGDAAARIHAAHAMFALGRYHEAIPFLRRAFKLQPRIAQLPLDMREDYGNREDFSNQLSVLAKAAGANVEDADLWLLLGYCRMYSGNPTGAYQSLKQAAELRADDRLIEKLLETAKLSAPASTVGRP